MVALFAEMMLYVPHESLVENRPFSVNVVLFEPIDGGDFFLGEKRIDVLTIEKTKAKTVVQFLHPALPSGTFAVGPVLYKKERSDVVFVEIPKQESTTDLHIRCQAPTKVYPGEKFTVTYRMEAKNNIEILSYSLPLFSDPALELLSEPRVDKKLGLITVSATLRAKNAGALQSFLPRVEGRRIGQKVRFFAEGRQSLEKIHAFPEPMPKGFHGSLGPGTPVWIKKEERERGRLVLIEMKGLFFDAETRSEWEIEGLSEGVFLLRAKNFGKKQIRAEPLVEFIPEKEEYLRTDFESFEVMVEPFLEKTSLNEGFIVVSQYEQHNPPSFFFPLLLFFIPFPRAHLCFFLGFLRRDGRLLKKAAFLRWEDGFKRQSFMKKLFEVLYSKPPRPTITALLRLWWVFCICAFCDIPVVANDPLAYRLYEWEKELLVQPRSTELRHNVATAQRALGIEEKLPLRWSLGHFEWRWLSWFCAMGAGVAFWMKKRGVIWLTCLSFFCFFDVFPPRIIAVESVPVYENVGGEYVGLLGAGSVVFLREIQGLWARCFVGDGTVFWAHAEAFRVIEMKDDVYMEL